MPAPVSLYVSQRLVQQYSSWDQRRRVTIAALQQSVYMENSCLARPDVHTKRVSNWHIERSTLGMQWIKWMVLCQMYVRQRLCVKMRTASLIWDSPRVPHFVSRYVWIHEIWNVFWSCSWQTNLGQMVFLYDAISSQNSKLANTLNIYGVMAAHDVSVVD